MNSTLKGISLNLLLRNFFSGAFFLGSIYRGGLVSETNLNIIGFTLGALISGSIVYGIHRTLFNPWIEIIRYSKTGENIRESDWFAKYFISLQAVELLVDRWDRTLYQSEDRDFEKDYNNTASRYRGLSAWADYIHLFYCSGLSIVLGAIVTVLMSNNKLTFDTVQILAAIAFIALGLLSDFRRHYVEFRCIRQPAQLNKIKETDSIG